MLLALANPSVGQTGAEQDHTAHHPDETQSGAIQPGAERSTPGSPQQKAGAPAPDAAAMGKAQMDMMMQMMGRMMASGPAGRGEWPRFERIEGQLAYYRTELKITDAQTRSAMSRSA